MKTSTIVSSWKRKFLTFKKRENRSDKTIKSYEYSIDCYIEFLKNNKAVSLNELASCLDLYLMWSQEKLARKYASPPLLKKIKYSTKVFKETGERVIFKEYAKTIGHRLVVVKIFICYISRNNTENLKFESDIKNIAPIGSRAEKTSQLNAKEQTKVVEYMMDWDNNYKKHKSKSSIFYAFRDSFMLLLYALSGAKSEEIVHIKLKDIVLAEDGVEKYFVIWLNSENESKKRSVVVSYKEISKHYYFIKSYIRNMNFYISSSEKNGVILNKPLYASKIRAFNNEVLGYLGIKKSGLRPFDSFVNRFV